MNPPFIILEHPSDLGIEAYGRSMEEMFMNASLGLVSVITDVFGVYQNVERKIMVQGLDRENLLIRWLNELLYLFHVEKLIIRDVRFTKIADRSLEAVVTGELYNPARHELKLDIKAITYHQLKIEEIDGTWTGRVFVDV